MNIDRNFEPYRLIAQGKVYKIEHFNNDIINVKGNNSKLQYNEEKIIDNKIPKKIPTKQIKTKKKDIHRVKKQTTIEYLKYFFDGLSFIKKGLNSFTVNNLTFGNAIQIYNFLFKNSKTISGIDILKLRNLLKYIKEYSFKKLCKNAKVILGKL